METDSEYPFGAPISMNVANHPIPFEYTDDDGTMYVSISREKEMFNTNPEGYLGFDEDPDDNWDPFLNEYQGGPSARNYRIPLYDQNGAQDNDYNIANAFGNYTLTTVDNNSLGLEFIHDGGPQSGGVGTPAEFTSILNTNPQNFLGAKIIPNIGDFFLQRGAYIARPIVIYPQEASTILDGNFTSIEDYGETYGKIFFSDDENDHVEFPVYVNFYKDVIAEYRTVFGQTYPYPNLFSPDSDGAYLEYFEIRPISYFGYENSDGDQVYDLSTGEKLVASVL
jgi:hypothetical protein